MTLIGVRDDMKGGVRDDTKGGEIALSLRSA